MKYAVRVYQGPDVKLKRTVEVDGLFQLWGKILRDRWVVFDEEDGTSYAIPCSSISKLTVAPEPDQEEAPPGG